MAHYNSLLLGRTHGKIYEETDNLNLIYLSAEILSEKMRSTGNICSLTEYPVYLHPVLSSATGE